MIDFSLSADQVKLLEKAKKFAKNEIAPLANQYDASGDYPESICRKAFDEGLMYTNIPKEYGGSGLSFMEHYIVGEALNYECCAIAQMIGISHLATGALDIAGTESQKKRLLGRMCERHRSAAFCLTESEAGSDVSGLKTIAIKKGDAYVINGSKCYITNGAYADLLMVFASTAPEKKNKGISCFAIPSDTLGIKIGKIEDKLGQRALSACEIFFNDVVVPAENLIGREGDGFKLAMMALDRGRVNITSVCVGIMQKAFDEALTWARERKQFGQPIGQFQGVHFMLADMFAKILAARTMYLKGGWMLDNKINCTVEAATAKIFASDAAVSVTMDAIQICGGRGYMKGNTVEKLFRDSKLCQIFEGTNQINRIVSGLGVLKNSPQNFHGPKEDNIG
ncbi:MAG: acyl-CoA dehydrogenase family protein [Deltaproteobacteria bacterium]|nr:acyl-CoA dehydrogenase family protein [Deltaproteobacteria bacterium]